MSCVAQEDQFNVITGPHAPTCTATPGPGNGEITLTWAPSTKTGRPEPLGQWRVGASKADASGDPVRSNVSASTRSHKFTGLDKGVSYNVGVVGRSSAGDSGLAGTAAGVRAGRIPPAVSSATVSGTSLAIVFDEALDTAVGGTPAASAFTVTVGTGAGANPSAVTVSGSTVTLTLATAVTSGQTVTVSYTAPMTGRIRSAAGNWGAKDFSGRSVTNNTPRAPGSFDPGTRETVWSATLTVKATGSNAKGCADALTTTRCSSALTDNEFVRGSTTYQVTGLEYGSDSSGNYTSLRSNVVIPTDLRLHVGDAHYDVDDAVFFSGGKTATWDRTASQLTDGALVSVGLTAPPAPSLSSATVDGTALALVFDQVLDTATAGTPAASAFAVTVGSGAAANPSAVSVSGSTVTLTLATLVTQGQTVTVTYTAPTSGGRLRSADGNRNVATFTGQSVTNNTPPPPTVSSATVNHDSLAIVFDQALDTAATGTPAVSFFAVAVNGVWANPSAVSVSGSTVTLTLAARVTQGQAVVLNYTAPTSGGRLRSADGNRNVASISQQSVTNNTPPPLAIVSATAADRALAIVFDAALDASAAGTPPAGAFTVTVNGAVAPSTLSISGSTVTLALTSHGTPLLETDTVTVTYTAPTSGGAIRSLDGTRYAGDIVNRSVEVLTAPVLTGAAVNGRVLVLTFHRSLVWASAGRPAASAFTVMVAGVRRHVSSVSIAGATATLRLASAVALGETVTVAYDKPAHGGALQSPDGRETASFGAQAVRHVTTDAPAVSGVEVEGDRVTVTFDRALDPDRRPSAGRFRVEQYFRWYRANAVRRVEIDRAAPRQLILTLSRSVRTGAAQRIWMHYTGAADSNALRGVYGDRVGDFSGVKVVNRTPVPRWGAPGAENLVQVGFNVHNSACGRYRPALTRGESNAFQMYVCDVPQRLWTLIQMAIPGVDYRASNAEIDWTLVIDWNVVPGHCVLRGYDDLADQWYLMSTSDRRLCESAGADVAAVEGKAVGFRVALSTPATAGAQKSVDYETAGGTATAHEDYVPARGTLVFGPGEYVKTVRVATLRDGEDEGPETVHLRLSNARGFTLSEAASERVATIENVETGPGNAVAVVSDPGPDATYGLGETIRVRVAFDEAVAVDTAGGTPRLKIKMDPAYGEKWAAYESGSGTDALVFAFGPVAAPNYSAQGIAVLADSLELNGGAIASQATGEAVASLGHWGLDHDPAHKVDHAAASDIAPAAVTAVAVVSDPGTDATYALGDTIRVRLAFDEAVAVDTAGGTPRLRIKMDPAYGEKWAAYESGSGSTALVFAFGPVAAPNHSPQGIAVLADSLELNGGAIASAATRAAAGLGHAGLGHDPAHKVDHRVAPDGAPTGPAPLTASFHGLPAEHDGRKLFSFDIRFSEEFQGLRLTALKAGALRVTGGRLVDVKRTVRGENRSVTARVRPASFEDVTLTLAATADCAAAGAVCASGGRKLSGAVSATVRGPAMLSVADARAEEGSDATIDFAVSLSRAVSGEVTVAYATRDGTATAGEDYTFTRGTLVFAAGETEKTVSVPILDDVLDEGEETFGLKLTNAQGAAIGDGEATGTIANSDPLQKMWLSRFGRTVADHVTGAVADRLSNPLTGAQVTVGGQTVNLAETGNEERLGETLTALARVFGAPSDPGQAEGSGPGHAGAAPGPGSGAGSWPGAGLGLRDSATLDGTATREIAGRELLLGSAFHLAREGDGRAPGLAAWGRVTVGGFDGEAPADEGNVRIDGDVTTGILGADAEWRRLLAGVAVSVSEGEGTFAQRGVDSGTIESTMTTVSPYARVSLSDRVSVWGLAGYGTGDMTIVQAANDATGQPERITRTDLSMRLAALGGRGALLKADETGGFDLALKADGFFVETTSEAVSNEGDTSADASRVRLALEGSRAFQVDGGGVLTPGLELGLRYDGGDAETGTGVELGGRVSYTDPETGLSVEANVRALIAHEDTKYREWGASGALRLAPGERGRGLSFSLAPTYGAPGSGVDRLWSARDAQGLAPGTGTFEPESRLQGELGYGLPLLGDRFTGTPNLGFGLTGAGSRDYRIGWRLTSAVPGDPGFEVNLDATRREPANDNGAQAEHGVMLRGAIRW